MFTSGGTGRPKGDALAGVARGTAESAGAWVGTLLVVHRFGPDALTGPAPSRGGRISSQRPHGGRSGRECP